MKEGWRAALQQHHVLPYVGSNLRDISIQSADCRMLLMDDLCSCVSLPSTRELPFWAGPAIVIGSYHIIAGVNGHYLVAYSRRAIAMAPQVLSIWRPKSPVGWYSIGDVTSHGVLPPAGAVVVRADTTGCLVSKPAKFRVVHQDKTSGYVVWRPVPRKGQVGAYVGETGEVGVGGGMHANGVAEPCRRGTDTLMATIAFLPDGFLQALVVDLYVPLVQGFGMLMLARRRPPVSRFKHDVHLRCGCMFCCRCPGVTWRFRLREKGEQGHHGGRCPLCGIVGCGAMPCGGVSLAGGKTEWQPGDRSSAISPYVRRGETAGVTC